MTAEELRPADAEALAGKTQKRREIVIFNK